MNGMPRRMENGHWSIPFSMASVVKVLENFDPANCSIEGSITIILRLKFTGIPDMETIINWVLDNCKIRVNEVEGKIIEPSQGRSGKVNRTISSDWVDGPKDML